MALVDRDKLRANYEGLVSVLGGDGAAGIVRPSVTARLIHDVTVESTFVQYDREFRFVGDEAASRGGREEGPSPMRYFLSGLAFCLGIVLLGARLAFDEVVRQGAAALAFVAVTTTIVLVVGAGSRPGPRPAATRRSSRSPRWSRPRSGTSRSQVATITGFGVLAVLVYPLVGKILSLPSQAFGLWAGAAINDTSQVVATGYAYDAVAGDVAVVTKLTRNPSLGSGSVPRFAGRVQITTDGHLAYIEAIEAAFGANADYAQLIKTYGVDDNEAASPTARRYSPNKVTSENVRIVSGDPDGSQISTSIVERSNLTMRMGMRRYTRLTNGFSKKVENLAAAVALHFLYYNFVRTHASLPPKTTPAMAAGLTDRVWTVEDIAKLLESN